MTRKKFINNMQALVIAIHKAGKPEYKLGESLRHVKENANFDDDIIVFEKNNIKPGDMEEFFREEGRYLDGLCDMLERRGEEDDSFTVSYVVTVKR